MESLIHAKARGGVISPVAFLSHQKISRPLTHGNGVLSACVKRTTRAKNARNLGQATA